MYLHLSLWWSLCSASQSLLRGGVRNGRFGSEGPVSVLVCVLGLAQGARWRIWKSLDSLDVCWVPALRVTFWN